MNETQKPFILATQHYLYEVSGQAVVGYFPWRESVIVVFFDASRDDCLENIRGNSRVLSLSVEDARKNWIERESNNRTVKWCRALALENYAEIECRLRTVCSGLAVQFRDSEAARTDPVDDETEKFTTVLDRIIKQMKVENKTSPVIQEYTNYNYPMEA